MFKNLEVEDNLFGDDLIKFIEEKQPVIIRLDKSSETLSHIEYIGNAPIIVINEK